MIQSFEQPDLETTTSAPGTVPVQDWQNGLPTISTGSLTLRELRLSDATSLAEALNTEEVTRFVAPPPSSVRAFERFIAWTHVERAAGRFLCFGIVPEGCDQAIGIIQLRRLGDTFEMAEWGTILASGYWGRGVFAAAARELVGFAFDTLGTRRLEARVWVANVRANRALEKLGAAREHTLPQSFLRDGVYHDQVVWTIGTGERQGLLH